MTSWVKEGLDIAARREDGTLRPYTTIWVVRIGDELYVRSLRGQGGTWYRATQRRPEGRIRTGGVHRDATFEHAKDVDEDAVDAAYRSKYGPTYLDPMLAPAARKRPCGSTPPEPPATKGTDMTNDSKQEPSGAEKAFGDFAPGFVHFTDDVLFGEVWQRPQLSPRDRSLLTVAALTAGGNPDQLTFHLQHAKDNGATEQELIEAITHLAFYTGWPKAFSAMAVAKQVFRGA
jgi:4-carboxymuconolactone decarboxylase